MHKRLGLSSGIGLAGVGVFAGFWIIGSKAMANDNPCYMITSSGQSVNLGSLCRTSPPAAPGTVSTPRVIRAPIKRRSSGTPVIDVTFNGTHTFEMVFDTGASGTLITRDMAIALNVRAVDKVSATIADGSVVDFPVGYVRSISVGNAEVRNIQVAIADRKTIGLLGYDFFENFDIKIRQNVVEFHRR